jgi:glucosamine-6-phosphate deaminase
MSGKAAGIIAATVLLKPDSVLGLATGSSPIGVYDNLIEWYKCGRIDFSKTTAVNLDEYKGAAPDTEQGYRFFMEQKLFSKINIPPENRHIPDGLAADPSAECERYDSIINRCGGIDLQLLGIGLNGHIGFNEPDDEFAKDTHVVDLTASTIEANSRFFSRREDVPVQAYTMGIRTIMRARKILLIVSGEQKADIVKSAFFGAVTPRVPASILQFHGGLTVVGDKAALSLI